MGIPRTASADEIEAAYKLRISELSAPASDASPCPPPRSRAEVEAGFQILTDPELKPDYDVLLSIERPKPKPSVQSPCPISSLPNPLPKTRRGCERVALERISLLALSDDPDSIPELVLLHLSPSATYNVRFEAGMRAIDICCSNNLSIPLLEMGDETRSPSEVRRRACEEASRIFTESGQYEMTFAVAENPAYSPEVRLFFGFRAVNLAMNQERHYRVAMMAFDPTSRYMQPVKDAAMARLKETAMNLPAVQRLMGKFFDPDLTAKYREMIAKLPPRPNPILPTIRRFRSPEFQKMPDGTRERIYSGKRR